MDTMEAIAFIIALSTVMGEDGIPGKVPLEYGAALYEASTLHGVDPVEMGALLLAENRSRKYDPNTVGVHGKGGEVGLYQLHPMWGGFARKTCENTDCVYVPEDKKVKGDCSEDDDTCVSLFDARVNTEAAVIAVTYMKRSHEQKTGTRHQTFDWRAHYRCARESRNTERCRMSVSQVLRWEKRLRKETEKHKSTINDVLDGIWMLSPVTEDSES